MEDAGTYRWPCARWRRGALRLRPLHGCVKACTLQSLPTGPGFAALLAPSRRLARSGPRRCQQSERIVSLRADSVRSLLSSPLALSPRPRSTTRHPQSPPSLANPSALRALPSCSSSSSPPPSCPPSPPLSSSHRPGEPASLRARSASTANPTYCPRPPPEVELRPPPPQINHLSPALLRDWFLLLHHPTIASSVAESLDYSSSNHRNSLVADLPIARRTSICPPSSICA
jgi:hypothetical protein